VNLIPDKLQHAAKAVVAGIGAFAALVLQFLPGLPDPLQAKLTGVVAVATFVAVYLVPNLEKILDADPVDDVAASDADAPARIVTSTPATMSTPADPDQPAAGVPPATELDGADDLTAADDGTDVTHDGSLG
jgi:hypothetical protein